MQLITIKQEDNYFFLFRHMGLRVIGFTGCSEKVNYSCSIATL